MTKRNRINQYMIFENECGVCHCEVGVITYQWAHRGPDKMKTSAHQMGHTIHFFTCEACGAVTMFESVPVISKVFYPDKRCNP